MPQNISLLGMRPAYLLLNLLFLKSVNKHTESITGLDQISADRSFIIAANHIDFLDGLIFLLPFYRKTQRRIWVITHKRSNYFLLGANTLPVDPANKSAVVELAAEKIKQGENVCLFPEGERNSGKKLLPGKTGAARLSLMTGAPVLPVGLIGPSGKTFLDSLKLLLFNRGRVQVAIGQPIFLGSKISQLEEKNILTEHTRLIMKSIGQLSGKTYEY